VSNRQAVRSAAARSDAPQAESARPIADNDVDTSVLDKLIDITRQQRQLDEFRTRAEAKKDRVDAAVYRRVLDDYNQRDAALDKEAQPLKAQARQEFEKLRALFDTVNGREERARYDKQELEFRHEVGEMDGAQLAERLQEPAAILEECQAELDGLGRQKARFLEAFDEEELARPELAVLELARPERAAPGAPSANVPFAVPSNASDMTMMAPVLPDIGATLAAAWQEAGAVPDVPATAADDDSSGEHTFILPEGTLVGRDPDGGKDIEYRLSAINYIGRAVENQIRIQADGVSRRHALVSAGKNGFIIKDLKSQNGTLVNDKAVDECLLAEGDAIKLGEAKLVFKTPKRRP
jgi:hypothetical protein